MKALVEHRENIHSCSKCGLCQSVCPIYKITGNDCTVSRGLFVMLKSLIKGELKMTKTINKYLDLCLKCGACSKFCPSDIDVVGIITSAKAEYFRLHPNERIISFLQKFLIKLLTFFPRNPKSQKFNKQVIYFGGCGDFDGKSSKSVIKILNACGIEVITPKFTCCGIPFYVRGDSESYKNYRQNFEKIIRQYNVNEIVTTCASCEKTLKGYGIKGLTVSNIFEYLKNNELKLILKKPLKVTFHKPCNINNMQDIDWILTHTENLEYVQMDCYDECCGLNGLSKFSEYGIMLKLFTKKHKNILKTGAKTVLTSCLGCDITLKLTSLCRYSVCDMTKFLAKNLVLRK